MSKINDAVYLIDDDSILQWGSFRSGWDFINRGGEYDGNQTQYWLLRGDGSGEVYLRRDCRSFEGGSLTLETKLRNIDGSGLYIRLGAEDGAFLSLHTDGEALFCGEDRICGLAFGVHYIKIIADLPEGKARIYIDAKFRGEVGFIGRAVFSRLTVGYDADSVGSAGFYFAKLYVNYLFNDYNYNQYRGGLSDEYEVSAPEGCEVVCDNRVEGKEDYAYYFRNKRGLAGSVVKRFRPSRGVVALELKYLMIDSIGRFSAALCGEKAYIRVSDEGDALTYSGEVLRTHHKNVWQTLRIEADTDAGRALIWLNGKPTRTVDFDADAIDSFELIYDAAEDSSLSFSDIKVWVKPPEPEDYVPEPVIPEKRGDYVVGMNICSLWREGTHQGWDCITPYDDIKPVLGYYDEGLPETSDWEIKFMVEHGIDYELYCWYSSEVRAPIKSTHLHYAWLDGHFHAKYSDKVKFALLWEAANCAHPTCLEDFKANLVPYWLDYFFSDPRYMRIDNKAIMSCFGVWCVEQDLGGAEKVREGLDYLRSEVKKLGYDDLIVMGCHADPNQLKNLGFDAFHAYHWGTEGYKLETNINSNEQNYKKQAVHIVPTVSVGFKNIGWGGERRPNLSAQDMYKGLVWCRDEMLPRYEKDSWKSRLLHLSTWNEYGEGTYMMPSGLNGFGYLDAVRRAICADAPHTDIIPTEKQKERICYLHLQSRRRLERMKYDVRPLPETDTPVVKYEFTSEAGLAGWRFNNITDIRIENGRLRGRATAPMAYMELETELDASLVAYGEAVLTNRHGDSKQPTLAYFAPSFNPDHGDYDLRSRAAVIGCDSTEPKAYRFDLDTRAYWKNTLRGIRFVPTYSGEFELCSITLYAPVPHMTVLGKDGGQLFFGDYIEKKSGEYYLPLDPASGIYKSLGCEYEWKKDEGRLTLIGSDYKVELEVGRPYAVRNGENFTLLRPTYLKDGIPTLSLTDMKALLGVGFALDGRKLRLI